MEFQSNSFLNNDSTKLTGEAWLKKHVSLFFFDVENISLANVGWIHLVCEDGTGIPPLGLLGLAVLGGHGWSRYF